MTSTTTRFAIPLLFVLIALVSPVATAAPPEPTGEPRVDPARPWAHHLEAVDRALERRDVRAAVRAWHEAYTTAHGGRTWEGMLETAGAYLRIGKLAGVPSASKARQLYLTGLFRARGQRSLDGVLRTAQGFADLGDTEVVGECLRIATELAGANEQAIARVNAFRARVSDGIVASPALR